MYPTLGRSHALLTRLAIGPVIGVEVGVLDGVMSREMLERENLTLLMIDTWEAPAADAFVQSDDPLARLTPAQWAEVRQRALRRTAFAAARRLVIIGDSSVAASTIARQSLDFAFIDADHSYEAVARDIAAWRPCIKPGGLLCGHDYRSPYPWTQGVTRAVDEFAQQENLPIDLGEDHTWFIKIPAQDGDTPASGS